MAIRFSHSGDLGDIIYALPTLKAKWEQTGEKAILELFDTPGKTAHGMTEAKVIRLKSLLMHQDYIEDVVWNPRAEDSSLNGFRHHGRHGNLADMHLATHGLPFDHRIRSWIKAPRKNAKYRFLFSRSPRYHNSNFPWQAIVYRYGAEAAFVGFREEYEAFCNRFGFVRFAEEQDDFAKLASLIAGCELFIGNQSSPLSVAHGMKHKLIMEISPGNSQHHCVFQRMDCIIGWDQKLELPEYDDIVPRFALPRDFELWREVYFGREYPLPFQFPKNTVVIDIGAHVGSFALSCLHRGAKRVVCVEPNRECVDYLDFNLRQHGRWITLVEKALWKDSEKARLSKYPLDHGTILGVDKDGQEFDSIGWRELLEKSRIEPGERVILKSDAEGAEYVLLSPENDFSMVDEMFIETHNGVLIGDRVYNAGDAVSMLEQHGFTVSSHKNGPNTSILKAWK